MTSSDLTASGDAGDASQPVADGGPSPPIMTNMDASTGPGMPDRGVAAHDGPTLDVKSPPPSLDSSAPPDAAGDADDVDADEDSGSGIPCGGMACSGNKGVCCFESTVNGPTACVTSASQCGGVPVGCASAMDCPGNDVCCGTSSNGMGGVQCEHSCGSPGVQFCASSSECPNDEQCMPSMMNPQYSVCSFGPQGP